MDAAPVVSWGAGLALGLSLAGPPGPVNALIAREATRHGWWAGLRAGLAAPLLDTLYMVVVLLGVARLVDLQAVGPFLAAAGAAMMAFLAWSTVRMRDAPAPPVSIAAAVVVTATNPFQYAWWLSAGLAFMTRQGAWGIAGFLMAIFGWVLVFSLLVARGASRWPWFAPVVTLASADLLFGFALQLAAVAAGL
jgi:threonine/homoserine/homoserine lactone efflux protein